MLKKRFFLLISTFFSVFPLAAQSALPVCTKIEEEQISPNKIRVTWQASRTDVQSFLIFRDERPIHSINSLQPIAELPPKTTTFTDTVKYYGFYCYAVIARLSDGTLEKTLIPSANSSAEGVRIAHEEKTPTVEDEPKIYPEGSLREQPLPRIAMFDRDVKKKRTISENARKNALALAAPIQVRPRLAPHIFEEDLVASPGGDDYVLFNILKTSFIKKDYESAISALNDFLRLNREEGAVNRAIFYIAESYHFLGDQKRAVSNFLKTSQAYPALSRKWIDESLDEYELPSE